MPTLYSCHCVNVVGYQMTKEWLLLHCMAVAVKASLQLTCGGLPDPTIQQQWQHKVSKGALSSIMSQQALCKVSHCMDLPWHRFGFNNTTLSERQGALGVAGEYQYLADPIHHATRKPKDESSPTAPFRPANPPLTGGPGTVTRNFGGRAKGAVGEFEWRPRPDAPEHFKAGNSSREAESPAGVVQQSMVFRPVSIPHKGPMATFNKFPGELLQRWSL